METTVQNDRLRMKRFLAQYFNAKRKIRHLEKRLAAVRAELRHPTLGSPPMDGMPHGTSISSGAAAARMLPLLPVSPKEQSSSSVSKSCLTSSVKTVQINSLL